MGFLIGLATYHKYPLTTKTWVENCTNKAACCCIYMGKDMTAFICVFENTKTVKKAFIKENKRDFLMLQQLFKCRSEC